MRLLVNWLSSRVAVFTMAFVAAGMLVSGASADVITQWNFNTATGTNNTPTPSTGTGSATPVGMNSNANNADILAGTGSSDAGVPNNAWRVRGSVSNGWSGTTQLLSGAQFNTSTAGYSDVVVTFDLNATDGSPRYAQMQYTTDGTNFISLGALLDLNPTNGSFANGITYDLSSIPAADNNPNFGFKLVSAFSPVEFTNANGLQPANTAFQRANAGSQVYDGTAGNWRFDMVTFSGTAVPEPSTVIVAGLGVILAACRRMPVL